MDNIVNEISKKYISRLSNKKILKLVKFSDAKSGIQEAVDETAHIVKQDMKNAVKNWETRLAQKDEFILNQKKSNEILQNQNDALKETNVALQSNLKSKNEEVLELQKNNENLQEKFKTTVDSYETTILSKENTIEKYKSIVKEAYKQGITPEIREQKSTISSILTSLLQRKLDTTETKTPSKTKKNIKQSKNKVTKNSTETTKTHKKTKSSGAKKASKQPVISQELMNKIKLERKKQVLDKTRMDTASDLLKELFEDIPVGKDVYAALMQNVKNKYIETAKKSAGSYTDKKINYSLLRTYTDKNGNIVCESLGYMRNKNEFIPFKDKIKINDNLSIEREDNSNVCFKDKNNKPLLLVDCYHHYFGADMIITIYDKNGAPMVDSYVKDGVVTRLDAMFNDVKSVKCSDDNEKNNITKHIVNLFNKRGSGYSELYGQMIFKKNNDNRNFFQLNLSKDDKSCETRLLLGRKNDESPYFTYGSVKTTYGPMFYPLTKRVEYWDLSRFNIRPWDFNIVKNYIK